MRVASALFLAACLGFLVNGQSQRKLLGKLVKGDDQSRAPVGNAKVVLDESGSQDVTRGGGLFELFLPDVLRPGDEVTVTATVLGFAIYEPPGGRVRIPADLARTRVEIQLLPKRSLKFLSDSQLRAFVERGAGESSLRHSQPGADERPHLNRYLRDWAVQYGFSVEEVQAVELDRWVAGVRSSRANAYDLGLSCVRGKQLS